MEFDRGIDMTFDKTIDNVNERLENAVKEDEKPNKHIIIKDVRKKKEFKDNLPPSEIRDNIRRVNMKKKRFQYVSEYVVNFDVELNVQLPPDMNDKEVEKELNAVQCDISFPNRDIEITNEYVTNVSYEKQSDAVDEIVEGIKKAHGAEDWGELLTLADELSNVLSTRDM